MFFFVCVLVCVKLHSYNYILLPIFDVVVFP
jgi:hypothetical protein